MDMKNELQRLPVPWCYWYYSTKLAIIALALMFGDKMNLSIM